MASQAKVKKVIRAFIAEKHPQVANTLSVEYDPKGETKSGQLLCEVKGNSSGVKVIIFARPGDGKFEYALTRAAKSAAEVWAGSCLTDHIRHRQTH